MTPNISSRSLPNLAKLIQKLSNALPSSSTVTLTKSGNVTNTAQSSNEHCEQYHEKYPRNKRKEERKKRKGGKRTLRPTSLTTQNTH